MAETVIVALISLAGTFIGAFGGLRLTTYRIQQLEKKQDKHNSIIERTYKLEKDVAVINEKIGDIEKKLPANK